MPLDDTRLLIHPRSPDPYCRGTFHAQSARRQIESARRLRIAGEVSAARFALRAAAVERKNAAYEFTVSSYRRRRTDRI